MEFAESDAAYRMIYLSTELDNTEPRSEGRAVLYRVSCQKGQSS